MLIEKLWNNEMTIEIVRYMIKNSIKTYNMKLQTNMSDNNNRYSFLAFISDDIYEFDCISCFAKLMIDLNINTSLWKTISSEIQHYNEYINNNECIYKILVSIQQYYNKTSDEYKFIGKIMNSYQKSGVMLKQSKLPEINKKINLIENKLSTDYNENTPMIILSPSEIVGLPIELIKDYYNKSSQNYELPLSKQLYNICHKFIVNSNVRKKIDDKIYDSYQKNIPKLTYLFIYKHVKANMLGYDTYLEHITHHQNETIRSILENIIIELSNRCNLEMDILSQMKQNSEHTRQLNTWDITYYINKWKLLYGINENEISPYFEINNTITNIFNIVSKLFSLQFTKVPNAKRSIFGKFADEVDVYKITQNGMIIGELTLDLYSRQGKLAGTHTVCINNKCYYPFEKKLINHASIILNMSINRATPTLLSLGDISALFNEIGKIIYYVSSTSSYSLFGGMYTEIEIIDSIGKFVELIMFGKDILKLVSKNYTSGQQLSDELVDKILNHRKLDYGITYKYQCLYGLYDLFVHSQVDFINNCKSLMRISDVTVQKEKILDCMYKIYNMFYETIFNVGSVSIHKEEKHFHPVLWSYLFNGSENVNFLKILSEIYAHDLYQLYEHSKAKSVFCCKMTEFIAKSTMKQQVNILEEFTGRPLSSTHMLEYFGLGENDTLLSLYNIDPNKNVSVKSPQKNKGKDSLYLSPDVVQQKNKVNHFEQTSENDPKIKKMLSQVMR